MEKCLLLASFFLVSTISVAENLQVEVIAVHAVTHSDRGATAIVDKRNQSSRVRSCQPRLELGSPPPALEYW
jgi:hypothetical protein